jgi:hypothetical protein
MMFQMRLVVPIDLGSLGQAMTWHLQDSLTYQSLQRGKVCSPRE